MWTIPLFLVKDALALKAGRMRARAALNRAVAVAGGGQVVETAIRQAVIEAESAITTMIYADKYALSGAGRQA